MEIFLLFAAEVIAVITFTTAGAYFVKKITVTVRLFIINSFLLST